VQNGDGHIEDTGFVMVEHVGHLTILSDQKTPPNKDLVTVIDYKRPLNTPPVNPDSAAINAGALILPVDRELLFEN